MHRLRMQTENKADTNYRKLAELFPNAVTETIDENGNVVRAIDKDVLMQEISCKVVEGNEERYQFTWPDKKKTMLLANAPINKTLRPVQNDEIIPTGADNHGKPYCSSGSVDFKNTENISTEKYTSSADVTTEINKDQMYTWLTNYYANSAETNAVENLHTLTGNKIKDQQSETADNAVYYVSSYKNGIWDMAISISVNNYTYAANFSITNNGYNKSKVIGFVKDYITNGTVEGDLKVTGVECQTPNSTMQLFNAIDALANQNENINQA